MKIAVLITCFNRKDKTVKCLQALKKQMDKTDVEYDVHLTDDGCTDGTAEAVLKECPDATIYKGGNLYWAGGMRLCWKGAISTGGYDYYLLLNDDTFVNDFLIPDFYECHKFGKGQTIIVGNTCAPITHEPTYVGMKLVRKFPLKCVNALPNGKPQIIAHSGANIWFVPSCIVESIGVFPDIYVHAVADGDYCWRSQRAGFRILGSPHYCGYCDADHGAPTTKDLRKMSIKKRWEYMLSPKGQEIKQHLYLQWEFFPWRWPFAFCKAALKVLLGIA